jgi:hypothetical protein
MKSTPPSNEQILAIAHRKGMFVVSWRYRDDSLRKRCRKLVRKGLLRRWRGPPGQDVFRPVDVFS